MGALELARWSDVWRVFTGRRSRDEVHGCASRRMAKSKRLADLALRRKPNVIRSGPPARSWNGLEQPRDQYHGYKGYPARIEYDDEDGIFTGRIAGMRDGVGLHTGTVDGLREAFHEAVEELYRDLRQGRQEAAEGFLRPSDAPSVLRFIAGLEAAGFQSHDAEQRLCAGCRI